MDAAGPRESLYPWVDAPPASAALLTAEHPILALDTASPTVSVAIGYQTAVLAERSIQLRSSSESLLTMIDEALDQSGVALGALYGIVVLGGPGSFTGLRVGMATVLGFHQALRIRACALPTLDVLTHQARRSHPSVRRFVAAVDALRGQWFARSYEYSGPPPAATGDARRISTDELLREAAGGVLVGHGLNDPEITDAAKAFDVVLQEASRLAPAAIELASGSDQAWNPASLIHPLYLRAPAVSLPRAGDTKRGRLSEPSLDLAPVCDRRSG